MSTTIGTVWLSCHVFYHGDTDPLLTDLLLPMVDGLRQDGRVRRHFYLRHWERGPHVRLRLEVRPEHRDGVRSEVERRIRDHLRRAPGPADTDPVRLREALHHLSELEHGTASDEELRTPEPPNTVRWIRYEPELAKYGGAEGMEIAEDVFHASSLLAGQVLRLVRNDRTRLGVSLQMLLLASRALGLGEEDRLVFLRSYHERWSGYVADERLLAAWDEQYRLQRSTYTSLIEDLDAGRPLGKGIGERWEHVLATAIERLRPLVEAGRTWPAEVDRSAPPLVALATLTSQYLHTTSNRMNVRPQGECFVAYLAHRAAREQTQSIPAQPGAARS
ncbi:lantibiotic biosynthesis protein [Planomonospora parontospora subsp. parontospora]|uniref:Lantibiotic biosynthesis protein n=2 Tax=Planomonospora parontospora TaxID=58119 RepID=A0AA37BK12_9ACTN|nr:lantibiotic dehydratase C-terminal domain-containing protein [Planomonospora parontospora]GGK82752.1 lantibiotic biosynthesis protein [Planomonospora parontospora]GII12208.1 lantibiotic biosynthesis protein [Planomonospora parontospora subsp. parontospora]